jgi:hypothetical protein
MGKNESFYRPARLRRWVLVGVILLVPALLLMHLTFFNRWYLSPADAVSAFEYQPNLPVSNPRDITDEACSLQVKCRAAIEADEVAVYQFWTRGNAKNFTETLGDDGYQSDWIVLRYEDAATPTTRDLSYGALIDGAWTSD